MLIKFKNADILNKDYEVVESQDLIVENNRIKEIKKTDPNDTSKYDRVVECNRNYLIPGIKNSHSHNAMVFLRSISDDIPLLTWLRTITFPNEAKLTQEDIYYFFFFLIMESLTSGIVASMDMYLDLFAMADASIKTGFRINICDTIQAFNKRIEPEENYVLFNNYKNDNGNLVKYTPGIHAEYTCNEEIFKRVSDLVHKYKSPFFTHNSETKPEVDECKERWNGLTPTQVLDKFGLYDFGGGGLFMMGIME